MIVTEELFNRTCGTWSDIQDHLPRFSDLVVSLDAQVVIELGVRWGTSAIAWLHGLQQTGGYLFAVDIEHLPIAVDGHHQMMRVTGDDCDQRVLRRLPLSADIVFVDSSHRYEHTCREIELYAGRVRPGGVMVFHDTNMRAFEHLPDERPWPVRTAVEEWIGRSGFSVETYSDSYGLAIVTVDR